MTDNALGVYVVAMRKIAEDAAADATLAHSHFVDAILAAASNTINAAITENGLNTGAAARLHGEMKIAASNVAGQTLRHPYGLDQLRHDVTTRLKQARQCNMPADIVRNTGALAMIDAVVETPHVTAELADIQRRAKTNPAHHVVTPPAAIHIAIRPDIVGSTTPGGRDYLHEIRQAPNLATAGAVLIDAIVQEEAIPAYVEQLAQLCAEKYGRPVSAATTPEAAR